MSNISDLSGDERDQRIAELKKKMQEAAAKRAQEPPKSAEPAVEPAAEDAPAEAMRPEADTVAEESVVEESAAIASTESIAENAKPEAEDATPAPTTAADTAPEADEPEPKSEETEPAAESVTPVLEASSDAPAISVNAALTASATGIPAKPAKTEEQKQKSEMNRREFLTYTWGAATGLLLLGSAVATFQFMYPRFKAGEFGGAFLMGPDSAVPSTEAAPEAIPAGKFWWVNVEVEGPQALYMVCTHLGCLYKWVDERGRFECPCHGSKFTREGLYIEGPAPRSLDRFVTELVDNIWVVDTGAKIPGAPASESQAAGTG